jgi:hypothetical protein
LFGGSGKWGKDYVKRSFAGPSPEEGCCSIVDPSTTYLFVMRALPSIGRIFGGLWFL